MTSPPWRALAHRITNALEDVRIERAVIASKQPPNGGELLGEVCEHLALNMGRGVNWNKFPASEILGAVITLQGRVAHQRKPYGDLPLTRAIAGNLPTWAQDLFTKHKDEILSTTSTGECYALAARLLAELPKKEKPKDNPKDEREAYPKDEGEGAQDAPSEPQDAPTQEDGPQDQDDDENAQETPSGAPGGNPDDTQDDDTDQDNADQREAYPSGEREAGDTQGGASTLDEDTEDEITELILDALDLLRDLSKDKPTEKNLTANDLTLTVAQLDQAKHETQIAMAQRKSNPRLAQDYRAKATTAGLAPKVRQMLHSQDDCMVTRYETRGRLDRKAITRGLTGDPRLFTRRAATDGIRTGVSFLLDFSSSMASDFRVGPQAMAAIALGDACQRAGAEVVINGFGPCASRIGSNGQYELTGVLLPFKGWAETMDVGAARLAGHNSGYGTNLSPSLMAAAQQLAARPGLDRRILLVMTDGQCQWGGPLLKATATFAAAKYDVILIGLGIQIDVSPFFPLSVTVNNCAEPGRRDHASPVASSGMSGALTILDRLPLILAIGSGALGAGAALLAVAAIALLGRHKRLTK